ncbi:pyrimidine reductase [Reticulibacter mediterranei]|uniref:Pyrimidine reductase n=1 Tax=Reticulibacter mediterranei TaxID=2778369 RepID=A0A8J3I746_9CHLR|nr:dihydrofolate reductase family protein [Reticulibacter mediterranei]GHO90014.1 pyrimidine reductase [Reticulibacter mediterranei]
MKLRASEMVSLDGVMEAPDQWVFPYMDQEIGQDVMSALGETDAMLFGRKTYLEMTAWSSRTGEMADIFNRAPKYVVSTTLRDVSWDNSHVIAGNIVEEVAKLKAQPGGILLVNGSAELVRLLAQYDLTDEYYLTVAPLVLGKGKRLFPEGSEARLRLVHSKAYQTGIVRLGYEPVKQ